MKPASKRRIVVHTGESWRPGPLSQRGLVLDDFLAQVDGTRGRFALGPPKFCLKDLLSYPSAKIAIERLIQDTVNLHDGEMYSQPHPLLGECGKSIFGEPISTAAYSGQRISSPWVVPVLQRVLELGLQTVVQLPIREPKPGYAPRQLKV